MVQGLSTGISSESWALSCYSNHKSITIKNVIKFETIDETKRIINTIKTIGFFERYRKPIALYY